MDPTSSTTDAIERKVLEDEATIARARAS